PYTTLFRSRSQHGRSLAARRDGYGINRLLAIGCCDHQFAASCAAVRVARATHAIGRVGSTAQAQTTRVKGATQREIATGAVGVFTIYGHVGACAEAVMAGKEILVVGRESRCR